ncbi:PREDICTED: zinc finger protein 862-like [Gekko japonicus]|uniref:Zinc finger protein 862-like n=1 Tax=Gekko japonicus TaxID=146911 RepID=A0ABM1KIS7_GEKJA|nr:PREDICTED: zinc finger protein 862-like [Gekko japonicus]
MVPPGKKPAGETSNSNKKCKRYFNERWKEEFAWLEFDYKQKTMFCAECRQALVRNKHGKAENAFTVGTDNFQRHALLRHVTSGAHRQALAVNRVQMASEAEAQCRQEPGPLIKAEVHPVKVAALTTVYWMAKEEVPNEKWASLLELQKFNLCQALLSSDCEGYSQPGSIQAMQAAIAKVLDAEDKLRMKSSPFIGLVVDETVDALERRRLVLFSTAVSLHAGQTSITFLGTIPLPDSEGCTVADKTIKAMLSFGLPTKKVAWLNSVGSSPLTHRPSGIWAKVKAICPLLTEVHCLSHHWSSPLRAAKDIFEADCVEKYEAVMDALCRLSVNFAAGNSRLRELQNVFQFCEMDTERPKAIHWSSILPALEAVDSSWPTLLSHLESESERSPMALDVCEELKKFYFVAFTKVLLDTLPVFQTLNRFFLLEDTDLSILKPIVSATIANLQLQKNVNGQNFQVFLNDLIEHPCEDCKGAESRFFYRGVELSDCSKMHVKKFEHFKKTYLEGIRCHLQDRFPSRSLEVVSSLSAIFNPKCYPQSLEEVGSYGIDELNFLLQAYSSVVVSERALDDFPLFKRLVFSLRQLSYKDLCAKLVYENSEMHQFFPDFAILATVALVMPFGSVLREKINRARELLRQCRWSYRKEDQGLFSVMKIALNGPALKEFDFSLAVDYYESNT